MMQLAIGTILSNRGLLEEMFDEAKEEECRDDWT
jgi:hypothetical protein